VSSFGFGIGNILPLLDAVEALQGRDGDKDDNSLLAVANLDLIKIPSQHASSRTKPWTASRPVPQKSMILRLSTTSRLKRHGEYERNNLHLSSLQYLSKIVTSSEIFSTCER